jgi:RNA polymerase sigma-70 factor, ECF subfamily
VEPQTCLRTTDDPRRRRELDAATLAAAQAGADWACRSLVECYQHGVHALIWRMLGSAGRRSLADDLTQEAFLRAFGSLPRFDPTGSARLSTWLLSIAARTTIDELRRKRPMMMTLDAEAEAGSMLRPDLVAERDSIAAAIVQAIDQLGPEIRAAFVLRAYHELSYPEIAAALQVDLGTVKSRLWRARQTLQVSLKEIRHER